MAEDNSKKRLGRGLAALMGDLEQPAKPADNNAAPTSDQIVTADREVPIEQIQPNPNNPRKQFSQEELEELSASIREHGIVQPILVRTSPAGGSSGIKYEIIAGERRWRAAQRAQLHEVPILVRDVEDKQALEIAIIENVQRSDLNSVEEALGYQQLMDEYQYTQNDLAQVIGKSRSHVANTLRLLKLPRSVQEMIGDGSLSAGHARTLITADDPEKLAKRILADGLSVRQAETLAHDAQQNVPSSTPSSGGGGEQSKHADIRAMEQRLEDTLGLKIDLRHSDKGKGELRIRYKSLEQLDDVCRRLGAG